MPAVPGIGGLPLPKVGLDGLGARPSVGGAGQDQGFGDVLKEALGALDQANNRADASALKLATGEQVDVHEVMLDVENASLTMQAAMQFRNKLVDAYQEIMRMSV